MPGADHFLPVWLLHVIKEVYHTAIDAPNFPRHHLRYGPKEIRGTRDKTDKTRNHTQGGDPESLHHVPRPSKIGGKIWTHPPRAGRELYAELPVQERYSGLRPTSRPSG